MNIKSERGNIFRVLHTSDLEIERVSTDTVKIIFAAGVYNIVTQVDSMYGVNFIYVNKWSK